MPLVYTGLTLPGQYGLYSRNWPSYYPYGYFRPYHHRPWFMYYYSNPWAGQQWRVSPGRVAPASTVAGQQIPR